MSEEDHAQVMLEIALGVREPEKQTKEKNKGDETAPKAVIEGSEEAPTDRQLSVVSVPEGAPAGRRIVEVDPARCRIWKVNQRSYELLSEASCRTLLDSISERKRSVAAGDVAHSRWSF